MTLHTYCPQWLENGNDPSFLQKGHQGQSYQLLSNLTHLYLYSKLMEHILTSAWCPTSMSITFYTTYSMVFVRIVLVKHGYRNLLSTLASGDQTDLIILDFSRAIAKVC